VNVELLLFFVLILGFGGVVLWFIATKAQGSRTFNQDKYRSEWLAIDKQLVKDNEASYHLSILNADKLLDRALKEAGYKGTTMGDRMKSAKDIWSNANHVWTAHKLRNQIAHETNVKVSYDTTRRALVAFKQALKDVGAI
jgi:transposase